ncbi:MAG TPA: CHAT domain-containing protein [Fimbriimonadaceae bacterium]|nr:CHAT domain-containing protein [Fimbriimonadaceae bacterium]
MTREVSLRLQVEKEFVIAELVEGYGQSLASVPVSEGSLREIAGRWKSWKQSAEASEDQLFRIGDALTECVMTESLRAALQEIAKSVHPPGLLRIGLDCGETFAAELPWELLKASRAAPSDPLDGYLVLQPQVSVFRRAVRPAPRHHAPVGELRVLGIVADPGTARFPRLAWLQAEVRAILAAQRFRQERVKLKWIHDAVPAVVERTLREFRPNVVHFAGHGESRPSGGVLILQGAEARSESPVHASQFSEWLAHAGVDLIVLSACNTGGSLRGFAEEILAQGAGAVVAMQAPAEDAWQPQFSRSFYGALFDSATIERALSEARHSLAGARGAWCVPVLFGSRPDVSLLEPLEASEEENRLGNLPEPAECLVGRRQELARIAKLLERETIVTLAGPGGVGKSRLALEAGDVLSRDFPDGVWFVACDSVRRPDDLFAAIASQMGLTAESEYVGQAVMGALKDKRLLLILDALEGFAAAGHSHAVAQLVAATSARCLATSRRALAVEGEGLIKVEPLDVSAEVAAGSANALFLQSARFRLPADPESRRIVSEICALLEGMPLALKIAASRLRVVGLAELLRLLQENRLRLLDGAEGGISQAMERSLGLLPEAERFFLWELSVFEGGFTSEDVTAVYAYDRFDVVDRLGKLADHSLIQSTQTAGKRRSKLLDVVREHIQVTMEDPALDWERLEARRRHANRFCELARRSADMLKSGDWRGGNAVIWADLANFRAALSFSVEHRRHIETVALVDALARSLMEAGLWSDFEDFAAKGYAAAEQTGDVAMRARLLGLHGAMAARRGDEAECRRMWRERVELCDATGDQAGAADALIDLAIQSYQDRDVPTCVSLLDEASVRQGDASPHEFQATLAAMRAICAFGQNESASALAYARLAMDHARQSTDQDSMLFVWTNAARVMKDCGETSEALDVLADAIRFAVRGNRRIHVAVALTHLAAILESLGQIGLAELCLSSSCSIYARLRSKRLAKAEERLSSFLERNAGHTAVASYSSSPEPPTATQIEQILARIPR